MSTLVAGYNTLWWVMAIYAIGIAIFMVLENKSPQSTLAWIFIFFVFPVIGLVIYFMFGRDHRAFSHHNKLHRQRLDSKLLAESHIKDVVELQDEWYEQLKQNGPPIYERVSEMMRRNANTRLVLYNTLEILQNGKEKYPRLMEDLKVAQHSIHMEYYEWASDELTEQIKDILIERAQAGVEVRILYDPIGSHSMLDQAYVKEMNAGGVTMIPWSSPYAVHTISYRSHRKIVVIDGKVGYIGGINMAKAYRDGPETGSFTGWRDTHTRVTGQVVWSLQLSYVNRWYNVTKESLADPVYFPPVDLEKLPYLPLQVALSGPDAAWKAIRNLYFALVNGATDHIYIQSPFFILDQGLAEAFSAAARSGVDVKIMLAPAGPDMPIAYRAGHTYAENMAETGVEIYYYQNEYLHAKTIMVDSLICSNGSSNMDIRSFSINYESNVIMFDPKLTQELEAAFINDLDHCKKFDVDAYKDGNVFGRARDSLFRLASPLL